MGMKRGYTTKGLEYHAEELSGSSAQGVCQSLDDCFPALSCPFLVLLCESGAGPWKIFSLFSSRCNIRPCQ